MGVGVNFDKVKIAELPKPSKIASQDGAIMDTSGWPKPSFPQKGTFKECNYLLS